MRISKLGLCSLFSVALACSSNGSGTSSSGSTSGSGGSGGSGSSSTSTSSSTSSSTTGSAGAGGQALDLPEQVSACSADLNESSVEANLELVGSLDNSVHELVACGGLTVRVVGTLVQGIIEMIASNDDDITPDGLMFEGNGTYRSGATDPNQDTDMLIRFYDNEAGTPVLIEEDIFLASTYLVGASAESMVVVDQGNPLNSRVVIEISYSAVGPRVGMLGFGDTPANPIVIEGSELDNLSPNLGDIIMETAVTVVDDRGDSVVNYDVETGPDPILDIFDTSRVNYRILSIDGSNSATNQTLELAENGWQIEFAGGNQLDGTIDFLVSGGDFDYTGVFTYESTAYADIALACAP